MFGYWDTLNFGSAPGLSGGRGEMAMAVASSARLACLRGAVCASTPPLRCTSDAVPFAFVSLCSLYSDSPLSSRPQSLGGVGDVTPCEDTREDVGLSVQFPSTTYCCRVFFYFVSPGPSGLMRASEQSVVRHAHSLRCKNATWVAAQPAVPEAVTRARYSQQCWVSCPELPGPSGLMRASERSRRRQLLLGGAVRVSWKCEWIRIAEPLFLCHDQPRVERSLRGGRALNVAFLSRSERSQLV